MATEASTPVLNAYRLFPFESIRYGARTVKIFSLSEEFFLHQGCACWLNQSVYQDILWTVSIRLGVFLAWYNSWLKPQNLLWLNQVSGSVRTPASNTFGCILQFLFSFFATGTKKLAHLTTLALKPISPVLAFVPPRKPGFSSQTPGQLKTFSGGIIEQVDIGREMHVRFKNIGINFDV